MIEDLDQKLSLKIDATGLECPLPILKTKKGLNGLKSGEIINISATDEGSVRDFEAFCKQTGNELLLKTKKDGVYSFYLKKR